MNRAPVIVSLAFVPIVTPASAALFALRKQSEVLPRKGFVLQNHLKIRISLAARHAIARHCLVTAQVVTGCGDVVEVGLQEVCVSCVKEAAEL